MPIFFCYLTGDLILPHLREVYRYISTMSDKGDAAAGDLGMAMIKLS